MKTFISKTWVLALLVGAQWVLSSAGARGQSVAVTLRLDTNQLAAGESTTLHVYAQVVSALRPASERIFSWYVDVLNTNGAAARGNYAALVKPASDNDPQVSSTGVNSGANRVGIYDTFLNLPGAGVANPVELASIPVSGLAAGRTRFVVRAGTGVPALGADFLVAPKNPGAPLTGGDYTVATADLQVTGSTSACQVSLQIQPAANNQWQLTFTPCAGKNNFVETTADLAGGWQTVPGGPHNSGSVLVPNSLSSAFFRVRSQ